MIELNLTGNIKTANTTLVIIGRRGGVEIIRQTCDHLVTGSVSATANNKLINSTFELLYIEFQSNAQRETEDAIKCWQTDMRPCPSQCYRHCL